MGTECIKQIEENNFLFLNKEKREYYLMNILSPLLKSRFCRLSYDNDEEVFIKIDKNDYILSDQIIYKDEIKSIIIFLENFNISYTIYKDMSNRRYLIIYNGEFYNLVRDERIGTREDEELKYDTLERNE